MGSSSKKIGRKKIENTLSVVQQNQVICVGDYTRRFCVGPDLKGKHQAEIISLCDNQAGRF
jgi:hypothetical protein